MLIGNYKEAYINFSNSLNIFTKVLGHEHPNSGFCYESMGRLTLD